MKWLSTLARALKKTRENTLGKIGNLFGTGEITESLWEKLEELLLKADVGVKTTQYLLSELQKEAKKQNLRRSQELFHLFKNEMIRLLGEKREPLRFSLHGPTVILAVGVNGTGKTTTIGKLTARLKAQGKKVFLAAADTFRAAAIEQLEIWAKRTGAVLIKHLPGADPAAVVYDAIKASSSRGGDALLIDTAGRLHSKGNLMEELKKIVRVIRKETPDAPHESLLILDAMTGQNALVQARSFQEAVKATGIILTKLDGTAKGGFLLAIRRELNLPIKFIGTGEKVEDLEEFDPKQFVEALL